MKVKDLRAPPLLSPPPEAEHLGRIEPPEVPPLILDELGKLLAGARSQNSGYHIAYNLDQLSVLVRKTSPTKDDIVHIRDDLRRYVERKEGWAVASMLRTMKRLGMRVKVTEAEVRLMERQRGFCRKTGGIVDLAKLHCNMRALGVGKPPTEADKALMLAELENQRKAFGKKSFTGKEIVELHYVMRSLGMRIEITDADRKMVSESMGYYFANHDVMRVIDMHYYVRLLADSTDNMLESTIDSSGTQLPPLKRFAR
jgi:hypothetical protein